MTCGVNYNRYAHRAQIRTVRGFITDYNRYAHRAQIRTVRKSAFLKLLRIWVLHPGIHASTKNQLKI